MFLFVDGLFSNSKMLQLCSNLPSLWSFHCICFADNGGGMNPDKMRHCMSLGYSAKSKAANTIGQCKLLLLWWNFILIFFVFSNLFIS